MPSRFTEANDSQVIMLATDVYILTPPLGVKWVKFTPQELGADWDVIQRLAISRSPVSFSTIVQAMDGDAQPVGIGSIDGRPYDRYRGSVDANAVMKALADAYASQGQIMFVDRFSGPVEVNIWIHPVTLLPRRLRVVGQIRYLGGDTNLALTLDFSDFNSEADVNPPGEYTPFSDLARSP